MTDKEKLELKDSIINIFNRFNILDHASTIGGLRDDILKYIDSLQEEPVSERVAFKAIPRLLEMVEPTDRAKAYIVKLADTLEVEGYSTDAKIVRESLKRMNGEKVAMATMDEEPVSEDLAKVATQYGIDNFPSLCNGCKHVPVDAFKAGAQWQKEQDKETIELAEDHAMFAGMEKMKEQMMANGVDGVVHHFEKCEVASVHYNDPTGVPMSYFMSSKGFLAGDKVKIIVIKEG